MAYTSGQVASQVSALTGLAAAAGTNDRSLIDQWIDEAMVEVFLDTSCYISRLNVGLTAGEDEYEIDRGILRVINYAQLASAANTRLTLISADELLQMRFGQSAGTVRHFAVIGNNKLLFYPTPEVAQDIEMWVVPYPDTVVAASTTDIYSTGLPTYGRRALIAYVCMRAMEFNHDYAGQRQTNNPGSQGGAAYWRNVYDEECGKIRKRNRDLGGRRSMASTRIGYPGNFNRPRNDVDYGGASF